MPRTARIKTGIGIYHIMMRSISDFRLFRSNSDKDKFLQLIKKYKEAFMFKIYSYCIMDTHVHLLIDSNGADISKFMHNINQCYAQYYNNKYNRIGHVFGDRFKSTVATNDVSVLCMSAYIHNNPKDIKGYRNCVENYKYSSLNIYLGKCSDKYNLIDKTFVLNYFHNDPTIATKRYFKFIKSRIDSELSDTALSYELQVSESYLNSAPNKNFKTTLVIRNANSNDVINYVGNYVNFNVKNINVKSKRNSVEFRSICAFLMRIFCSYNYKDIGTALGNIPLSSISMLCNKGYYLIHRKSKYQNIVSDFLEKHLSEA